MTRPLLDALRYALYRLARHLERVAGPFGTAEHDFHARQRPRRERLRFYRT